VFQGTISLWHSWEEDRLPALLRRIDEFRALYPNVNFDVLYVPQMDLRASFEAAVQEGGGPAILLGPAEWGPELYERGMIADLSGLASSGLLNTFNPAALGAGRYGEALIGLPQHIQGVVLYRNLGIVQGEPFTWSSLVSLAEEADRGEIFGAVLDRGFLYSGGNLFGIGGRLMDEAGRPAFNTPEGVQWLELLNRYAELGPTEYFTDNDLQLFKEGRAGFIVDGTWNWADLAEAIGPANLVIDPWPFYEATHPGSSTPTPRAGIATPGTETPTPAAESAPQETGVGDKTLAGFVQAENIYLGERLTGETGPEAQAAWKFIEFLLTPESQAGLVEVGLIPALKEDLVQGPLTELDLDRDDPHLLFVRQALKALEYGVPYPIAPEFAAYVTPLDAALQAAANGADPAEALATAEAAVLANLEALVTTPTLTPTTTSTPRPTATP
jgi:maltose-binding protein MalE